MDSDSPYGDLSNLAPQGDAPASQIDSASLPDQPPPDWLQAAQNQMTPERIAAPEQLPQPRDVTEQQPATQSGQPVPLDQWVRNQYGEAIRKKTGDPAADMAIVGGQGQNLARPTQDASGAVGQTTEQLPQLHTGTLKAIRALAEAAVPQIPNVPMHPHQRAQMMQDREHLIQGVMHQKIQFQQQQQLAKQKQLAARDENALKADRQEKRDKELHALKLQEAQAKAEETRKTAEARATQETVAHQSKTLKEYEKEVKAEYDTAVSGDKTGKGKVEEKDRPDWMTALNREEAMNNEAVRRAKQHHKNLGLPWKGTEDVREPVSDLGTSGTATTGKAPSPQDTTPPTPQAPAPGVGADDVTSMLSKAEEALKKAPSQGPIPFSSPSADDVQVRDSLGSMVGILRRAKAEGRGLTHDEAALYASHHHTMTKVAKRRSQ